MPLFSKCKPEVFLVILCTLTLVQKRSTSLDDEFDCQRRRHIQRPQPTKVPPRSVHSGRNTHLFSHMMWEKALSFSSRWEKILISARYASPPPVRKVLVAWLACTREPHPWLKFASDHSPADGGPRKAAGCDRKPWKGFPKRGFQSVSV